LTGLQETLSEVGRPDEFTNILGEYQKVNPTDQSVMGMEYETATKLFYAEKYDKAIEALREYIRKNPISVESYEAKYLIAEAYFKQGNRPQALIYYNQVIADNKYKFVNRALITDCP